MEFLPNGYTLRIGEDCFPLSTDSMVLAHFTRLPRNARVLDLGSGCGTLGLLLCAKDSGCTVAGIEINGCAHQTALDNISRNALTGRMESICADVREISSLFVPGTFSCCISNPPYFSGGPASKKLTSARREDACSLSDLCRAAALALKFGGDFYLVHRPERLGEIISQGSANGLEAKRLLLLRHKEDDPISLILLHLRKGAKPGLKIEEQSLFDKNGIPTPYYKEVYHME